MHWAWMKTESKSQAIIQCSEMVIKEKMIKGFIEENKMVTTVVGALVR